MSLSFCLCLSPVELYLSPPIPSLLSFLSLFPPFLLPALAELQSVPLLARSPSTNRKYPPLVVDKLEEDMNRRMADDNKLFREEFNVWSPYKHTYIYILILSRVHTHLHLYTHILVVYGPHQDNGQIVLATRTLYVCDSSYWLRLERYYLTQSLWLCSNTS